MSKVTSGPKTHTLPSSASTPDKGDRIFLHGLAVECIIGFIEWERRVKQTIVLDVEMPVDCALAAASDDVADTLDYKKVAKRLIAFVEASEFKLVETLAHRTALLILEEFGIEWVRLSINKPGAIRGSKDVGVAVLRTRADLSKCNEHPQARPRARVRRGGQQSRTGKKSRARLRAISRIPGMTPCSRARIATWRWGSTDRISSTWCWDSRRRSRWMR